MISLNFVRQNFIRPALLLADGSLTVEWGKTFWRMAGFFFTKTAITRKQKVEKLIQRCEIWELSSCTFFPSHTGSSIKRKQKVEK